MTKIPELSDQFMAAADIEAETPITIGLNGIEHVQPSDFAQVGALLAMCSFLQMTDGHSPQRWLATVDVNGKRGHAYGKTQLEAIRAAVEAAEQGVRE